MRRLETIQKSVLLGFTLVGAVSCIGDVEGPSGSDPSTIAGEGGDVCVGAEGMPPPNMTLTDILYVLQNRVPFYSANPGTLFSGKYTNWYLEPDPRDQLAKLAVMRGILDKFNLYDMYLTPLPTDGICGPEAATVRQIDGRCNNLAKPLQGAANVRFGRNIPPVLPAGDGTYVKNPLANPDPATFMVPNPREVSRKILKRGQFQQVPFLNMLAASWVQFQVHDWFSHGENSKTEFYTVPLAADDELRKGGIKELKIAKSANDGSRSPVENALLPPSYQNEVTHWWDGSQLYGSDIATSNRLRSFQGGKLKVDGRGLIPKAKDGFEDTGFRRNWWVGLALLHNLFTEEHNAIAEMLAAAHPEFTDQQLFDHARMINAALMAKIHTVDWTPAILPNPSLKVGMNANWFGLNDYLGLGLPTPPPAMQTGPADPVLYGIVGGNRDDKGVPYTLTEEFVSVYRMHPLLPEKIEIRSQLTGKVKSIIPSLLTRNVGARVIEEQYGMSDLLYSFGVQHPGALVPFNYPKFLMLLPLPSGITDMGTVDILRDRERGIPRYNDFRQQLRLPRLASLEELTTDPETLAALKSVYGSDADAINKVDLMVGTFAEATRPTCYGFGETLFQVFTLMASRRLQADRFYTNDYTAAVYTAEGLAWINDSSMKTVLLRHYPELAETGLANVDNAFYPWE